MFRTVLAQEIHDHLLSFRFAAALLTTFALIVISVWVLGNDYQRRYTTYTMLAEKEAQEAMDVYVPSRIIPVVHRPPSPLSIFAQGEEKRLGNRVEVHRWEVPVAASDSLTDNPLVVQQPFDLLAVFTTVISLFGILIGYDSISGDRERGTLKLICSYPLRRPMLYSAKLTAGVIVLLVPVLFSFISALIVLQVVHGIGFSTAEWGAIGLMCFNGCLFGALFVAVGLLTSSLVARSSTALILSLFFWTVMVLVIPGAAKDLATAVTPAPSPTEVSKLKQITQQEITLDGKKFHEKEAPSAGNGWGGSDIGGETPFLFDTWPEAWRDTEKYTAYLERVHQKNADIVYQLVHQQADRKKTQVDLANALGWLSPAYHLRRSFTALAMTDYASFATYMEAVRRFRSAFLDDMRNRGLFDRNILSFFSRRERSETQRLEDFELRNNSYIRRLKSGESGKSFIGEKSWQPLPQGMIPRFTFDPGDSAIRESYWRPLCSP